MSSYLLLGSRDPFASRDADFVFDLAVQLKAAGNDVTLLLLENGVLAARAEAKSPGLDAAIAAGVAVKADEFALRERGIGDARLRAKVEKSALDLVIDCMAEGHKTIWN
jgi:hypothetical protein